MFEKIREIGLFMIAAQAVIHFAPEKQYERYIKLVSGVIILFLFLQPFMNPTGNLEEEWQTGLDQMVEKFEKENLWQEKGQGADDAALAKLAEEVRSDFNEQIPEDAYSVRSVSFILEETASEGVYEGYRPQVKRVEVRMEKRGREEIDPVVVEDIVIGGERKEAAAGEAARYQEIFAGILGIEPERVEVICVGGW